MTAKGGVQMAFPPTGKAGRGYVRGWSGFVTVPGVIGMRCRVCASECEVLRGVTAHASWGAFVSGRRSTHDFFWCPWMAEDWHLTLTHWWESLAEDGAL